MKKLLLLLLMLANNAFAGRGAFIILNNMTNSQLKNQANMSETNCIKNVKNLNLDLAPNVAQSIYIEADNLGACLGKKSYGSFFTKDGKAIDITANYTLSNIESETNLSTNSKFANSFFDDNLNILNNQALFILNIKPQNYTAYSSWMENIKSTNKPIKNIIIPGTHDSFSYDLSENLCNADPDASKWLDLVNKLPLGSSIVANFAKAQHYNFDEQLANGIRYFDIRLCYQNNQIFAEHSMITKNTMNHYLAKLASYLEQHPKELVILDFNHIYGFNSDQAALELNNLLIPLNRFIADNTLTPSSTLDEFRKKNKNLIVLIDDSKVNQGINFNYWSQNNINSHWSSNATDINSALINQQEALNSRDNNKLFVSQLIENADGDFIKNNYNKSLLYFAYKDLNQIRQWIAANNDKNLNIIIENYANGIDVINTAKDTN